MGIELATAALLLGGAGSVAETVGNASANRSAGRRADRNSQLALGQVQEGPSSVEQIIQGLFNTGQDGGLQALRAIPGGSTLNEISETGTPFDTSQLFNSLRPIRERQLSEGLAQLRAGAPGLGQRFGSAMMRGEQNVLLQHLQNIAAQDAQTAFSAHESAQNRRLSAANVGTGITTNLLQLLGTAEQGRRGLNLGAVQTAAGIPQPPATNWGQPFSDTAQLMLLRTLMQNQTPAGGGVPAPFINRQLPQLRNQTLFGG